MLSCCDMNGAAVIRALSYVSRAVCVSVSPQCVLEACAVSGGAVSGGAVDDGGKTERTAPNGSAHSRHHPLSTQLSALNELSQLTHPRTHQLCRGRPRWYSVVTQFVGAFTPPASSIPVFMLVSSEHYRYITTRPLRRRSAWSFPRAGCRWPARDGAARAMRHPPIPRAQHERHQRLIPIRQQRTCDGRSVDEAAPLLHPSRMSAPTLATHLSTPARTQRPTRSC